jgi:hypothetical protein
LVASAAVLVASAAVVVASAAEVVASSRPRTLRRSSRLRTRKRPACLTAFEKTIFW